MADENQNQNNAEAPQPNEREQEKEQIKAAIEDSKKTKQQEITEIVRYPALKMVIRFAKMAGIILLVFFWIVAIVQLFVAETWGEAIFYFFICFMFGILHFILGWFLGDYVQLQIDIEENTRNK